MAQWDLRTSHALGDRLVTDASPADIDYDAEELAHDKALPRLVVSDLVPFAPSGAMEGKGLFAGVPVRLTFWVAEASDAIWSSDAVSGYLSDLATLPLGEPVRVFGALDRGRRGQAPTFRVRRVEAPDGAVLWDATPVARIALRGTHAVPGRSMGPVSLPARVAAFRALEYSYDADLIARLEAMDPATPLVAWTYPDNYFDPEEFSRFVAGIPEGPVEKRFLTLLEAGEERLLIQRHGTLAQYQLRHFGENPTPDFEWTTPITRADLEITRFDPSRPADFLADVGWGGPLSELTSLPADMAQPLPREFSQGLGPLFPDPLRLAPISALVTLTSPLEPIDTADSELFVRPFARDPESGERFGHSLSIFELRGGLAALPGAQAAAAAGRLWVTAREHPHDGQMSFDGVILYDGDEILAYAHE